MRIEAATLDERAAHDLLKGCVVPRPIAWISTVGENGVVNAAPYSCFTFLATRPPMVGFSVEPREGGRKKDTLRNVEETGDFVVNVVPKSMAELMNATAADFPPDVSEIGEVGLSCWAGERVKSPRIADCPVSMECRVVDVIPLHPSRHHLVIGEVLLFHIRDDLYRDGEIDQELLRPVGRLSGNQYLGLDGPFEIDRPWLKARRSSE